jgi:hypothetical protein
MKNQKALEIKNTYKYKMTKECFNAILATRQGKEKNMNPYIFVVDYINASHGLKGTCVEVAVY